ncbi:MAG TPA: hypothetical protein VEP89_14995 [Draconibacterium sp.]|nr:hypothetical protein [Draconibacterium sp.]
MIVLEMLIDISKADPDFENFSSYKEEGTSAAGEVVLILKSFSLKNNHPVSEINI